MPPQPRRVVGIGPTPCDYYLIGSKPAWEEDKAGVPFAGKAGEELGRYLNGDLLPTRSQIFLDNIYSFYRGKDYVYTAADLTMETPRIWATIERVQPKLIITLGREATRFFMGDVDMDDVHSIPWVYPADVGKPEFRTIFPITHIAAGLNNPEANSLVNYGFTQLEGYLNGEFDERILYDDKHPNPAYREVTDPRFFDTFEAAEISIDSEGWAARPWSIQVTAQAGESFIVRTSARAVVDSFRRYLNRVRPFVTYHASLHDLSVARAWGVTEFLTLPFDDTMVMAYLLQVEPQGLKPLAGRWAGMKMQSYTDTLGDADVRIALDYAQALWDIEDVAWMAHRENLFWAEIDKGRKISKFPTAPKSALYKAVTRVLGSKTPRKLWHDQVIDIQVAGYKLLGDMPMATLDHIPLEKAIHYAGRDTDATHRVKPELSKRIDNMGLREVYNLEISTYPLIERMHHVGLKPDLEHFRGLSLRLESELSDIRARLVVATNDPSFNANSGDQCAEYLFDQLQLEGNKKTASGRYSTNDKILEALEHEFPQYPVIGDIRYYRETYKLKNTFVDRLPDHVHRWPHDGRIHADFRTTRVVTGRLASSNPNLLAMPKHGKFAKDFRRGWVPEAGHLLAEWDLSQIELRILAHLSQDPTMLAIFRGEKRNPDGSKIDLHAALAERIFGVKPKDQDKSKHRLPAKAVNFGLPMGMTNKGLTVELRKNGVMIDEDDAQRWIDETMKLYAGVPIYQENMIAEARRNGFIRCLSGRIRYIGGIRSPHERISSEAKRFAFSTPIQEGAQWLMKQAEAKLYNDILVPYWEEGRWVEPLLQVHDALTLECEDDDSLAQDLNNKMVAVMTAAPADFSVPVETSGDWGYNWADMKEFA